MVLTSESSKQVVLVELTVPWEDQIEVAYEWKKAKYLELVEAIKVGCRGFPGQSQHWTLRLVASRGYRRGMPTKTSVRQQRKPQGGYGSREVIHGVVRCLNKSPGVINSDWIAQARVPDDPRPKTPCDPGFITEDASKLHHSRCFLQVNIFSLSIRTKAKQVNFSCCILFNYAFCTALSNI